MDRREITKNYGVYETRETPELELASRVIKVLQHPDEIEHHDVVRPSDPVRHLSNAIGKKELTLNNTPFSDPKFSVRARLFSPFSAIGEYGELVDKYVVAFDAYERKGTGDFCYDERYGHYARQKKQAGLVIVLKKAFAGPTDKLKLTVRDMEWDKNCVYGACIKPEGIEWFRISHKDANGNKLSLSSVFFESEMFDPNSEKAAQLNADLEEFLRTRGQGV